MSEYTLEDGRKAEKIENNIDPMTKVIEVYVEPKARMKLSQRITEKFCVCEREIETVDEESGEVVSRVVENLCGTSTLSTTSEETATKSSVRMAVEKRIMENSNNGMYVLGGVILLQVLALAYIIFFM